MNKKSQMEIMGLVVIVILVSIAMLFVIRFVILQPAEDYKSDYVSMEIASNLVSAILKTTSPDCYHNTFRELLQDCAENENNPSIICTNGQNSCDFAYDKIDYILDDTLNDWKVKYQLKAVMEGSNDQVKDLKFDDGDSTCEDDTKYLTKDAKTFPIPIGTTGGANLNVNLYICR